MLNAAFALAADISSKSPVAVQGSKINLIYSRDHSVDESLDYMVRPCLHQLWPTLVCGDQLFGLGRGENLRMRALLIGALPVFPTPLI